MKGNVLFQKGEVLFCWNGRGCGIAVAVIAVIALSSAHKYFVMICAEPC